MSTAGEHVRLRHAVDQLRALLDGFEMTLDAGVPCTEASQALADAAVRLVSSAARHDAYQRAGVP